MLPHLQARVALIFQVLDQLVVSVTPLSVNFNAFKLKIELSDGSNLRFSESYRADALEKYAYYWLDGQNKLIIGWIMLRITASYPLILITNTSLAKPTFSPQPSPT